MRAYWFLGRFFYCLHCARVGGRFAASGCGHGTARDVERCEMDKISKRMVWFCFWR